MLVIKDWARNRPTYVLHSYRPGYASEWIADPTRAWCT